jgi:hypothetical protein
LARAFNFEALLEKIEDVFSETGVLNEDVYKILLNEEYQRLFWQTFLTESEIDLINGVKNPIASSQTEMWLLKVIFINLDCQK